MMWKHNDTRELNNGQSDDARSKSLDLMNSRRAQQVGNGIAIAALFVVCLTRSDVRPIIKEK
jgi:hypothetical protein